MDTYKPLNLFYIRRYKNKHHKSNDTIWFGIWPNNIRNVDILFLWNIKKQSQLLAIHIINLNSFNFQTKKQCVPKPWDVCMARSIIHNHETRAWQLLISPGNSFVTFVNTLRPGSKAVPGDILKTRARCRPSPLSPNYRPLNHSASGKFEIQFCRHTFVLQVSIN